MLMKTTAAARKTITTEYRNAKAHLESVLGCEKAIGLDSWMHNLVVASTVLACEVKRYYSMAGADVSDCAVKTLAYARMGQAWQAYSAL